MQTDLYDIFGKKTKKTEISEEIFKAKINPILMAQAVRVFLANQRQGTQSAKTRGEVAGSGRKIYQQKGTGNARHGDRYAPIFVGGGIAFPPKPRDFSLKMTKKARKNALFSALSQQQKNGQVLIVDDLEKIEAKTKALAKILKDLKVINEKKKETKILIVLAEKSDQVTKAAGNLKNTTLTLIRLLNTYTVLNSDKIIFSKEAVKALAEFFLKDQDSRSKKTVKKAN
jgi:large subunit ribosomal protein L4